LLDRHLKAFVKITVCRPESASHDAFRSFVDIPNSEKVSLPYLTLFCFSLFLL
jgi:hypothetical protein